jgi:hypothetical protein
MTETDSVWQTLMQYCSTMPFPKKWMCEHGFSPSEMILYPVAIILFISLVGIGFAIFFYRRSLKRLKIENA